MPSGPKLLRAAIGKAIETGTPLREWLRPELVKERFPGVRIPGEVLRRAARKHFCWTAPRLKAAADKGCRNCLGRGSTPWERPCYCVLTRIFRECLHHALYENDAAFTERFWSTVMDEVGTKGEKVMRLRYQFHYSESSIAKMKAGAGADVRRIMAEGKRGTARELARRGVWPILRSI